ncbi:hypothetical protein JY96_10560 [Aquabacterium sp. NJ1]|nr:hypothetical protein JY96_10560 [Aquabacterium sp. NJ1]
MTACEASTLGINQLKALVVIRSVETSFRLSNFFTSANDAPRAAVTFAWGGYGVLVIETAWPTGQDAFPVAEHHTVLGITKGPTRENTAVDVLGLRRKGRQGHRFGGGACLLWCMATGKGFSGKPRSHTTQGKTSQESGRPRAGGSGDCGGGRGCQATTA